MTSLPALSDVIRETLTPEVLEQIQQDGYTWSQGTAKAIILNALLLPLTEREQGLREDRDDWVAIANANAKQANDAERHAEAAEARVSALTAEREDLADELASCEFCSRPFEAQREGGTIPCRIACCTDCWNSQHNVHLRADIERLTAEREALQAWLEERAKPNASSDYLFRHLNKDDGVTYTPYRVMLAELKRLAGAPHAPTQEKP